MVPFYDRAADLFRRLCPEPLVGLELERSMVQGNPTYVISAYTGPRSSKGIGAHHFMPLVELTWPMVATAIEILAITSSRRWRAKREEQERQMSGVKILRDTFNGYADGFAKCAQAFMEHGRPNEMAGKEAIRLKFEGGLSTGGAFSVQSAWLKPDVSLDEATADVVAKMKASPP